MKIAITGSSGLVGKALISFFEKTEDVVYPIVRSNKHLSLNHIYWNPVNHEINPSKLEGMDVIIHLAADNISEGRWTKKKKERIRSSRIDSTSFLSKTLSQLQSPPKVFLSASAIGYYGKSSDKETLVETSSKGKDYLAQVVEEWERATSPAEKTGIRVVHMRFGVILDPSGGALRKMLPPFRLGVGGKVGNGKQIMSWISLDEIPTIVQFIIQHPQLVGAVNVVSPHAIDNQGFTQALGKALHRPTLLTIPAPIARLLFGEMADYLLLSGNRVYPEKLLQSGYRFREPDLDEALQKMLASTKKATP